MSGGPQAAVAVFQKIAYSTPLLHGEEYLRIQYGPSWDPAPCRLSHETVEDFISVNPAANHGVGGLPQLYAVTASNQVIFSRTICRMVDKRV